MFPQSDVLTEIPAFMTKIGTKVAYLILLGVLTLAGCKTPQARSTSVPNLIPVSIAAATEETVPVTIHSVGTVEASAVIQVRSQLAGELVSVGFTEGGLVNKGDLLFEIDARPYRETLRQAQAALARDNAQLHQAEANLARDRAQSKNADADAARYRRLAQEGIVAGQQNDQSQTAADALRASLLADEAAIEGARASLESDRAAVDRANLDLTYCQIHSPVSGRAGNLLIHVGNIVGANGNPLVVIHQVTPIWITFSAPESYLSTLRRNSDIRSLPVDVVPRDNPKLKIRGSLSVIDNTVDTSTGTIRLKATLENRERQLWPGQFVDVTLTLDALSHAVLIPSEAIQVGRNGQMVYVVKPNQTVEPREVTLGESFGNKVIVQKGIAVGDNVVTDGQSRLAPGLPVRIVPAGKIDSQAL